MITRGELQRDASPTFGSTTGVSLSSGQLPRSSINRGDTGDEAMIIVVMNDRGIQLGPLGSLVLMRSFPTQGVSGTGKSTLGTALAEAMHLPFIDGDDLHPAANIAKMSRGEPLEDVDRQPWLEAIRKMAVACVREQLVERAASETDDSEARAVRPGVIVACSALKKTYRAVLRGEGVPLQALGSATSLTTYFVYLKGGRDVLMVRLETRQGHFMKAAMLESQLDTLESPEDEDGVLSLSVDMSTAKQVQRVIETFDPS